MTCPDDKTLQLFIAGRLAQGQEEQIEKHLEGCELCSKRLSELETKGKAAIFRDIQAAHADDSAMATGGENQAIPSTIPKTIGHYKVIDVLGSGGMGAVYLAENPHLDRKVAVKVVKASRSLHQSSLDRFSREMKAVGKLRHPNIVQALDGGVVDGQPYLVMEYLEGSDLSHYVKHCVTEHGPLPVKQACDIIRQVAAGLDYAHRLGYVHRDIKPSNLWMMPDGTVKILDFGLVGLLEPENGIPTTGETNEGMILGSLDFMPPEQVGNVKKADNRSDIYSLGCTLFYLLTGNPPFGKKTHPELADKIAAHAKEDLPPLSRFRKDVPASIDALLRKMTAKRPADRFQQASEIVFNEHTSNRSTRSVIIMSLVAMLLLLVAGVAVATKYGGHDRHAANNPIVETPIHPSKIVSEPEIPQELPVVRMTLEIDADNKGQFCVAKGLSTDPPDDLFQGEAFTHPAFPHASAFRGTNGMGRMIWGFDDPMDAWKKYDKHLATLQSIAEIKEGALWTYLGGGGLGIWNARFPIRITCDFPDIHNGELQIHIGGGINSNYGRFLLIVKCKEDETYEIEVWTEAISVVYGSDVQTHGTLKQIVTTKLEQPFEQSFRVSDTLRNPDVVLKRMANRVAPITRVDITARFVAAPEFAPKETDDELTVDEIVSRLNPREPRLPLGSSKKPVIEMFDGKPCVEVIVDGLPMFRPLQGKELDDWEKENGKNK